MPELALLLTFDGTMYAGDLPVLAFARHCAERLPDDDATTLIDGTRFLLEGRSIGALPIDLSAAQDGDQAVRMLARSVGLPADTVEQARQQARADMAASAWAMEAPPGLLELLGTLSSARVLVVTDPDRVGVAEVLDAVGVAGLVDEVVARTDGPAGMAGLIEQVLADIDAAAAPEQMMVVGHRWAVDLADAHRAGARTALVDRFRRNAGTPELRAADLTGLVPAIASWAQGPATAGHR